MSVWLFVLLAALLIAAWILGLMLGRKPGRAQTHYERAEALKLAGKFEEAIAVYRMSGDPAAREGIALALAHLGRDLGEARRLMEEQIAQRPQIQEFQALALAYILLRAGDREAALRLYRDNVELLETRFRDDYTDPDPLLAETLWMYAMLADANGEHARADSLWRQAAQWAPGSVWASRRVGESASSTPR